MITITQGTQHLSANLKLDLTDYCKTYTLLCESRDALQALKKANNGPSAEATSQIKDATEVNNANVIKFEALKAPLKRELYLLPGEMHWSTIKGLLKAQCHLDDPIEKRLYEFLTIAGTTKGALPLAIEGMDMSFLELLKNSIDALLLGYLKHKGNTILEMTIAVQLEGETLSIVVTDNAGGFSDEFLATFTTPIESKTHQVLQSSKEKRDLIDYCLGGAGRSLSILIDYVMHGGMRERSSTDEITRVYDIPKKTTAIRVGNNPETKGAEITLTTPLKPFSCMASPALSAATTISTRSPFLLFGPRPKSFHPPRLNLGPAALPIVAISRQHIAGADREDVSKGVLSTPKPLLQLSGRVRKRALSTEESIPGLETVKKIG